MLEVLSLVLGILVSILIHFRVTCSFVCASLSSKGDRVSHGSGRFAKMNLFSCLHLLINSLRLFRRMFLFLNLHISNFSAVHRLHNLVDLLNPDVRRMILQVIE